MIVPILILSAFASQDKNHGLVLQLLETALSRQIVRLTKTYEVLLVPEMAKLLGLEGGETAQVQQDLVDELYRMVSPSRPKHPWALRSLTTRPAFALSLNMQVSSKTINAKISYHTPASSSTTSSAPVPMVTFLPPAERYVGPEIIERLRVLNEDAARVNDQAWEEDRRVGKSIKYLQKVSDHLPLRPLSEGASR